jgi:polysaccharide export outer membrane protein
MEPLFYPLANLLRSVTTPSRSRARRHRTSKLRVACYVLAPLLLLTASAARIEAAPANNVRPKMGVNAASRGESYVLGKGDAISVTVSGYPEFNQTSVVIPPDGTLTLPEFGTLRIAGKTRLGVQRELATILRRKVGMRNPAVAVTITGFRPVPVGRVVLAGDVPRPGSFDIRVGQRLSVLLADAGLQSRLEERRATLIRSSGAIPLNLKAAATAPRSAADIVLRPGDSITVTQVKTGSITLLGDLARSGVYELHPIPLSGSAMELSLQPRLSDLITRAGGLRLDNQPFLPVPSTASAGGAAGQTNAQATTNVVGALVRPTYRGFLQRGGKRLTLDPAAALSEVTGPANIRLRAGDVVDIQVVPPPQPLTVYLDGISTRTGSFQVTPGTGIYELITTAGGLTGDRQPEDIIATLRRGNQTLPLDLPALLLSSQSGANLTLQNGDIVQLREPEVIEIRMAGRVAKPGPLRLKPGSTIYDAILESGGLSVTPEDARLNVLRRQAGGGQQILDADAAEIVGARNFATNITLQEGDTVNVAQNAVQTVIVSGRVNSPSPIQLREGEGLTELLVRAGGVKDDAALTQINVTREGKVITVDAYDAVRNGKPINFALQDRDIVDVPENKNKVWVLEGVAKPGFYAIPERGNLTLLDVLGQATPVPNTTKLFITRAGPDGTIDPRIKPDEVNLNDLRRGKQPNRVLKPRDIVFVPSPKSKRSIIDTLSSISVFRLFFP